MYNLSNQKMKNHLPLPLRKLNTADGSDMFCT